MGYPSGNRCPHGIQSGVFSLGWFLLFSPNCESDVTVVSVTALFVDENSSIASDSAPHGYSLSLDSALILARFYLDCR